MRVGAIALARSDSSRLPGKALRSIEGQPMLFHILEIAKRIEGIEGVCLATSDRPVDDELAQLATRCGCSVYRGSASDVARRFFRAMEESGFDGAARLNGDSPLHRAGIFSQGVAEYRKQAPDLVTNVPGRTYPYGVSVEVIGRDAMAAALSVMSEERHREHVSAYFYDRPDEFRIFKLPDGPPEGRGLQLAVDTEDDLDVAREVAGTLGERLYDAPLSQVIELGRAAREKRKRALP